MRCTKRTLAVAIPLLVAAACGKDNANQQQDAGQSAYKLALVGDAILKVHPGDKKTLRVVLAQDQVGPVANADIAFAFDDGDPAGANLDFTRVKTGSDGVATINLTAGNHTQFKLVASSAAYPEARPVAFSLDVVPVRRLLQIVGSPQVVVQTDGEAAAVTMYVSSSMGLKVRELDHDTGAPISQDTLTFSLPTGAGAPHATFSGATPATASVVTGAGGEGQVFLLSAGNGETFLVTAQSASGGAGAVSFSVTVQAFGTSSHCSSSQQCPPGQICVGGNCTQDTGGGQCTAGTDHPCPFGYECVNGICQPPQNTSCDPNNPNCPSGQQCACDTSNPPVCQCKDICPACTIGSHCNPTTGTCDPNPPPTPDVTGVWYTKHAYSISAALPTILADIFKAFRIIDQLLSGAFGLPSWLEAILDAIIKQYVPDWVKTVIRIGDDIGVILSNLRGEGAMRLMPGVDTAHVKGTEVWTSLVFYWLPLCGNNIGGDPDVPPDCARFDITTTDSDNPSEQGQCKGQTIPAISVKVGPFTGKVTGSGAAGTTPPFTLGIDQRQVQLKMGKVVLVVIDLLLSLTTQYHCIDEATDCANGNPCLVDCEGLGSWVAGWLGQGAGDVATGVCEGVVTAAGKTVTDLLAKIAFDTDVLDFNGHAQIVHYDDDNSVCQSQSNCATQLGQDNFDTKLRKDVKNRDGWWEGSFFYKVLKNMPGAWEAKRVPLN